MMKRLLLICSLSILAWTGYSQELGIRFGDALGGEVAIDAVFGTGASRIHAMLGFGDGVGIEVLWDVIYDQLGTSPLNWYLGVGPSARIGDPFLLGVAGELGLEWVIEGAPITIGADWRPALVVIEETDFRAEFFGLNVRYRFGE
jgi:hypothetical protein